MKKLLRNVEKTIWVTGGGGCISTSPSFGMIYGLARMVQSEREEIKFVVLALEIDNHPEEDVSRAATTVMKTLHTNENSFESELRPNEL